MPPICRDWQNEGQPLGPPFCSATKAKAPNRHTESRAATSAPTAASAPARTAPAPVASAAASAAACRAASTASVAAPPSNKLHAAIGCSHVFFVVDVESREANVRNFFLTVNKCRCSVFRWYTLCRTSDRGRSGARRRQKSSNSQHRYSFRPAPSLRSLLRMWHGETSSRMHMRYYSRLIGPLRRSRRRHDASIDCAADGADVGACGVSTDRESNARLGTSLAASSRRRFNFLSRDRPTRMAPIRS
jgi:hypothetical protein